MKLKIAISQLNERGALALLENDDNEQIHVCENDVSQNPKAICRRAAKILRDCADKFEALAEMSDPFKEATHRKVNRATPPKNYFLYAILDDGGLIRYVGITKHRQRRFDDHVDNSMSGKDQTKKGLWIKNERAMRRKISMKTIRQNITLERAMQLERQVIKRVRKLNGDLLLNSSFGGEMSGNRRSSDTRTEHRIED